MTRRLILAGGGHAHLQTLTHLPDLIARGFQVVVIQPSVYQYYSGMGPGMLAGIYQPEEIRFPTRALVEAHGGVFRLDQVVRIDAERQEVRLGQGEVLGYDLLSCNVGSLVSAGLALLPGAPQWVPVKPIEGLVGARQRLCTLCARQGEVRVAIIGGGPSAVELAAAVWQLGRQEGKAALTVALFAGPGLLPGQPNRLRQQVRRILTKRGIALFQGNYVAGLAEGQVLLRDSSQYPADLVFDATGVRPPTLFAASGLPVADDGGLLVNRYLQSISHPTLFGGGDCIAFRPSPLDRVGVYAVRQGPILLHNLLAAAEGRHLRPFDPGGGYLSIYNLGEGVGVLRKGRICFSGRLAFRLKDWIDRRFMRRYQCQSTGPNPAKVDSG